MRALENVLQYIQENDGGEAAVLSWMRRHHDDLVRHWEPTVEWDGCSVVQSIAPVEGWAP